MGIDYVIYWLKWAWQRWDVRGLMLLSLSLQILLLLLAPLRKRKSNNWLMGSLLCLYLLADWAPNYAAGVITSSEGDTKNRIKLNQPLAFWSTFLLVHLGGPDSITAFALQDNDFWHRHALALVFQCVSATYIFFQTLPENQLWLPTLLMFVCGFIKYYERTRSLYSASLNNLRDSMRKKPDPGTEYARMMEVFSGAEEAGLPTSVRMITVPERVARVKRGGLNGKEVVLYAHHFFSTFKRLIVDLKCSYYERVYSREFFHNRTAEDAFRVIELELNFMYDILFTKASFVYSRKGFLLRLFALALVITSFGLFYYEEKRFRRPDVTITYALLLGAIALDVIAFIQLMTSNWLTAAFISKDIHTNWLIRGPCPDEVMARAEANNWSRKPQEKPRLPRWSETVSTHNLINYCLNLPQPETKIFMDWVGLSRYFEGLWYVTPKPFRSELRDHIFEEVKMRSELAEGCGTFEDAITARGDWVLSLLELKLKEELLPYVLGMDYDQSLLSWHIATEICYHTDIALEMDKNPEREQEHDIDFSKILSDYMMYLVAMQPALMYGVADIGQTRLRDTCAEVEKVYTAKQQKREKLPCTIRLVEYAFQCFRRGIYWLMSPAIFTILSLYVVIVRPLLPCKKYKPLERARVSKDKAREELSKKRVQLCKSIMDTDARIEPVYIKGDKSKSVLYNGCRLAKVLDELGHDRKWNLVSRVWVEILTYAAVHCRPPSLVEQLSKGGELICFVWLLMAHFGLVKQFEVYGGLRRAKLLVEK